MVRRQHDLGSVIDDDQAVAQRLQLPQRADHERQLVGMQSGRRLIDHAQCSRHARPECGGEQQAASHSARERGRTAVQRQMIESQIAHEAQSLGEVGANQHRPRSLALIELSLNPLQSRGGSAGGQCEHVGEVAPGHTHGQRLAPQPRIETGRTSCRRGVSLTTHFASARSID